MKILLSGGAVVDGTGARTADVLIAEEKILAVGEKITPGQATGAEQIDVSGCLLFPGFIDAHTHFDLHVAGTVTADDFTTGKIGRAHV